MSPSRQEGALPMSTVSRFPIPERIRHEADISSEKYEALYTRSVSSPEAFWEDQANNLLSWRSPWTRTLSWDFNEPAIRWFDGGTLNVSENCLDRHLESRGDKTALIWEANDPIENRRYTYKELHGEVVRVAELLKSLGIARGDRVAIYLPMIPEAAITMLACTRIGAIHTVVFA